MLDGSVAQASDNVLIYATSNRRHLLPEYMRENLTYTHTETARSIPARWWRRNLAVRALGLWVSFYPFTQAEYLGHRRAMVASFRRRGRAHRCVAARGAGWALEAGSRSGRVAYQFAARFLGP